MAHHFSSDIPKLTSIFDKIALDSTIVWREVDGRSGFGGLIESVHSLASPSTLQPDGMDVATTLHTAPAVLRIIV
jgi:hypothetical protein